MTPESSVIIPAHNEMTLLGRCLTALLADALPGEIEVVVVANGCTDATADIARSFPGVVVVELDVADKATALNAGDAAATGWPRLYVDADVVVSTNALRQTTQALGGTKILAAAPRPHFDSQRSSRLVRAWYRTYAVMPYTQHGMIGSGVYGLSRTGHERLGSFPDAVADDLVVSRLFAENERTTVDATFVVDTPRTLGALVHSKSRVARANRLYARAPSRPLSSRRRPSARTLVDLGRSPRNWPDLAIYLATHVVIRTVARRPSRERWARDSSIRRVIDDGGVADSGGGGSNRVVNSNGIVWR